MIVKISGTNGSGKSTLIREIMRRYAFKNFDTSYEAALLSTQPLGKRWETAVVLGPYRTACGGMDALTSQGRSLVLKWLKVREAVVFFEGSLMSTTYGALGEMSERSLVKWVYVFLDTPYEECVRRVMERRAAKGNTKPFDPERSLRPKMRAIESVKRRAAAAGHVIYTVDSSVRPRTAVDRLLRFLEYETT